MNVEAADVCPHVSTRIPLERFSQNLALEVLHKVVMPSACLHIYINIITHVTSRWHTEVLREIPVLGKESTIKTSLNTNLRNFKLYRVFQKDGPNFKPLYFTMATCYNDTKNYKWFSEPSSFTNHFINALFALHVLHKQHQTIVEFVPNASQSVFFHWSHRRRDSVFEVIQISR
jgi:hypothetical protein